MLLGPVGAQAQDVAAYDPALEQPLVGKGAPALETMQLGTWEGAPSHIALLESDPSKNNYWIPTGELATLADGFLRARMTVGKKLDSSLLFRVSTDPKDISGLSGYGLSLVDKSVVFIRWDAGVVRTLSEETKLKKLSRSSTIEVTIWAVGPHFTALIYDGETLEHVHTIVVTDATYSSGQVGYRAYIKQGADTALTLLTMRKAGTRTGASPSPVGAQRFVEIAATQLELVPPKVKTKVIEERGDGARLLLAVSRDGLEHIRRAGVDVIAVETDGTFRYVDDDYREQRNRDPVVTEDGYRLDLSYKDAEMVEAIVRGYHARYPKITKLVELGRSHQGRPILALKISDHPMENESEPSVLLNGGHHGVEFLSTEFVLDAMHTLLASYRRDPRVRRWVDHTEIWVVPLVNPDGNNAHMNISYSAGRKNGRDLNRDGVFEPTEGVDPNRNYPFRWHGQEEVGSSSRESHKWYRGPVPGSEPETQAIMRLADAERFVASISYHTWGSVILAPYTTEGVQNPDPNEAWVISEEIAAAVGVQSNGRKYRVQRNIYPVDGVDQDWLRAAHGTVALLVEGAYHNPRSPEKRALTIERNRETWMQLLDRVSTGPSLAGVVENADGEPLVAEIVIAEMQPLDDEHWTSRCRDGRFQRLLPYPGTFTVRAMIPGHAPLEKVVTVRAGKQARVDFRFDVVPQTPLAELLCPNPEMCAAETVCGAKAGTCVEAGPATSCLIDGQCLAAGASRGEACTTCAPTLAREWSPVARGEACGAVACEGGELRGKGQCDGRGECTLQALSSCAPYATCADTTECATACVTQADCVAGMRCAASTCVPSGASAALAENVRLSPQPPPARPSQAAPNGERTEAGCTAVDVKRRPSGAALGIVALWLSVTGCQRRRARA